MAGRPGQLLVEFYGDDFSGSTAVLEVLALAGVPTGLLLGPPDAGVLERHPDWRAVGVAGVTRSLPPAAMEAELAPSLRALAALPARLVHYKVCSTFDSSPEVGSIGRAIELGLAAVGPPPVPVLAAAPALGRYSVFGNLFARAGQDGPVYRLDRHPTMSRHPVTPMRESDLARHLAGQTGRPIGLLDILQLRGEAPEDVLARLRAAGAEVVLLDALDEDDLPVLGRLLWEHGGRFVVGSSGVEDALTAYWQRSGVLPAPPPRPVPGPADRVLAVCGSCSPVTAAQIAHALGQGFAEVALDPSEWADDRGHAAENSLCRLREYLAVGRSVIVHAARGPDDPRVVQTNERFPAAGGERDRALARVLARAVRTAADMGVRRVAVAGGDTSGYVARELGLAAISFVAPLGPGVPLCRVHTAPEGGPLDGMEISFKGGQVGGPDFFARLRSG